MDTAHLEANFRDILPTVRSKGPRRTKNLENYKFMKRYRTKTFRILKNKFFCLVINFVLIQICVKFCRCYLTTSLKQEKLVVPLEDYMEEEEIIDSDDEDDAPAPAAQKV